MGCLNYEEDKAVVLIPTDKILISEPIISAIKNLGGIVPSKMKFDITSPSFGNLERLNQFKELEKDIFPPISLKKIIGTNYYSIIDGRHRVAVSIANKFSRVPSVLL